MSRTLAERARDWKWWGEQALHTLAGFAIVWGLCIPLRLFGIPDAAAHEFLVPLSCWIGGAREIKQNHGDPYGSLGDSLVDCAFWCLGAMIGGLV